jgi:hypothetical protein
MSTIYTASYVCKRIEPIGFPGYSNVVLGLDINNEARDIKIGTTCVRFEVGREYLITVSEIGV